MADITRYITDLVDAIRAAPAPAALGAAASQLATRGGYTGGGRSRRGTASRGGYTGSGSRASGGRGRAGAGARASGDRASSARASSGRSSFTSKPIPRTARAKSRSTSAPRAASPAARATTSPSVPRISPVETRTPPTRVATPPTPTRPAASPPAAALTDLTCPRCRVGHLLTGSRGWGCSRWREGFVIWFETAGRTLSLAQLRDLVLRGKTRKAKFRTTNGGEIDGRLVLDASAERGNARLEPA
jgi:DNA topoisomerase-3